MIKIALICQRLKFSQGDPEGCIRTIEDQPYVLWLLHLIFVSGLVVDDDSAVPPVCVLRVHADADQFKCNYGALERNTSVLEMIELGEPGIQRVRDHQGLHDIIVVVSLRHMPPAGPCSPERTLHSLYMRYQDEGECPCSEPPGALQLNPLVPCDTRRHANRHKKSNDGSNSLNPSRLGPRLKRTKSYPVTVHIPSAAPPSDCQSLSPDWSPRRRRRLLHSLPRTGAAG